MKKIVLILVCFIGFTAITQTPKERIKTLKTAFITKELDLTNAEAKEFWPIYEIYDNELENNRRKLAREMIEKSADIDKMNKEEANKFISDYLTIEKALYTAQENLIDNLKGILSPQRIAKLLMAESRFNQRMLQRFKARMGN